MASWAEERDRLVAQTSAFVQGIAAARPAKAPPLSANVPSQPVAPRPVTVTPPAALKSAVQIPVAELISRERAEISRRVAAFKALQTRFTEERMAYYERMRARIGVELGTI